jgi:hypothetical protein
MSCNNFKLKVHQHNHHKGIVNLFTEVPAYLLFRTFSEPRHFCVLHGTANYAFYVGECLEETVMCYGETNFSEQTVGHSYPTS